MRNNSLDYLVQTHLRNIVHTIKLKVDQVLVPYDITNQQARIVGAIAMMLEKSPSVKQKDIENIFGLKSSSITSLMQGLEKKEFIKRVTGINDTRTKELVLTDKGKELVAISRKVFDDVEKAMVKEFSDEERNQFLNYLERVSRSLE